MKSDRLPLRPTLDNRAKFGESLSPRKRDILEAAAQLFAQHGYQGTSIRDIGEQVGLLGGSLYHHIKSKDVLFVELHNAALDAAGDRIDAAVADHEGPWDRLAAACEALIEIQLDPNSLTLPLMNDFRAVSPDIRAQLIAKRDAFETRFRHLVDALPLPDGFDRAIYRISLLSLLNGVGGWYRPEGGLSPKAIADQLMAIFRH